MIEGLDIAAVEQRRVLGVPLQRRKAVLQQEQADCRTVDFNDQAVRIPADPGSAHIPVGCKRQPVAVLLDKSGRIDHLELAHRQPVPSLKRHGKEDKGKEGCKCSYRHWRSYSFELRQ
ncbi:hypothetical protein [Roseibium salinum]|uniref:Uncharacterized protein n=1 Tax=Roseibium salinum TaxID=1604349 RepID=A0ABT3QZR2_9HYPH|nr:hypothetical protein [Roseibium sp. DSM 29163]MCX2722454.1 hypothetical protein [Roseibium sp. DSM 29163]